MNCSPKRNFIHPFTRMAALFSVVLMGCQQPTESTIDLKLPRVTIGDGSETTAQTILSAASALSRTGTAWIGYNGRDGESHYIRVTGLPELKSSPLYGRIEHLFVELAPDYFVIEDEIFKFTEGIFHLQKYVATSEIGGGEPEIAVGAKEGVSGEALVVFFRELAEKGIARIIASGAPYPTPSDSP